MSVDSFAKTRGGKRESASRKKGSSVYGETTQAIRVPESLLPRVKNLLAQSAGCRCNSRIGRRRFFGLVKILTDCCYRYLAAKWRRVFRRRPMITSKNAGFKRVFGTKTRFCKIFLSLLNNWRKDSVYQAVAE